MELSKFKHIKHYMTNLELYYRKFERLTKIYQLYTTLQSKIEEVFENLETEYVDMSTAHSMIYPITNRNFGNKFHHQIGPNKRQNIH